jgi:hypothetical protein
MQVRWVRELDLHERKWRRRRRAERESQAVERPLEDLTRLAEKLLQCVLESTI